MTHLTHLCSCAKSVQWLFPTTAVLLLFTGCSKGPSGPASAPPPPEVTVGKVEQRVITEQEFITGRVEAVEHVEVRPRVSGYITEVRFQSGQQVQKGDVLFVIDPRPFQAALVRAKSELTQTRVRLEWARRDSERAASMLQKNAISEEEGDLRRTRLAEAEAALAGAEAAVSLAELNMEYSSVRSPIQGQISRALVTLGNNVSGVDGFNTLLTTVVSVDPIYVYSDVSEASLSRIRRASMEAGSKRIPVAMGLAEEEGYPREGFVESFDNRLDAGTGSIVMRTQYPNSDGRLTPGLFARVRVPVGEPRPALLVSEDAIGTDLSQKYVLTVTASNTVAYRPVKLGGKFEGKRVIQGGLQAGESVVVNGLQRVRPGFAITPVAEKPAAPPQQASR